MHAFTELRSTRLLTALAMIVIVLWPTAAGAHTGFESSDPADGAVVSDELTTITITFTNEAVPTGDGFVILDPAIGVRGPSTVDTPDVGVFILHFDPAIGLGEVGVRWNVKAPDAHPIEGAFQFTVETPPSTATTAAPEPTDSTSAPTPTTVTPAQPDEVMDPDEVMQSDDVALPSTEDPGSSIQQAEDLEEFLTASSTTPLGQNIGDIGRVFAMGSMMVALGFLVFALTVLRGTRSELQTILFWIRRAAVLNAVATVVNAVGQVIYQSGEGLGGALSPTNYIDVLSSWLGLALGTRFFGSVIVASQARVSMVHAHEARDVLATLTASVRIGAGSTLVSDHPPDYWDTHDVAWTLDRHGIGAAIGFVMMLLSHTFDGHTVTEGNRILTGLAASGHVLAAAAWAGGVLALGLVIHQRIRAGTTTHALAMVIRYSVVATVAIVIVAILGIFLAITIMDAPSELWRTAWGRLLIAKTGIVALAAALGAHNHHVLVPALEAAQEDGSTVDRLRATLRNEVVVLGVATAITAFLVRASSAL